MAKKILKRSLALGALMAFVITGSAMASTFDEGYGYGEEVKKLSESGYHNVGTIAPERDTVIDRDILYSYTLNQGAAITNSGASSVYINSPGHNFTYNKKVDVLLSTNLKGTGNNSANGLLVYGGNVSFKDNVNITAKATDKDGKSVYAVEAYGAVNRDAIVSFNGANVTIKAETIVDRTGSYVSQDKNSRGEIMGVSSVYGKVLSSANTNVEINVASNGTTVGEDYKNDGDVELGAAYAYGICAESGAVEFLGDTKVNVTSKAATATGVKVIDGFYTSTTGNMSGDAYVNLNNAVVNVSNSGVGGKSVGLEASNFIDDNTDTAEISLAGNLDLVVSGDTARGVQALDSKKILLGGEKSDHINIDVKSSNTNNGEKVNVGVFALSGSQVDINTKNLVVNSTATGKGWAYGVSAQNNTTDATSGFAQVNIKAEDITITSTSAAAGQSVGLVAMSQGVLNVNGNLVVTADSALTARGGAKVNVNTDGAHTTVFNGNIDFNYDAATSGTKVDADVNINFAGAESAFNGKINITGNPPSGKNTVSGMKIQFNNGATWNLTGASMANDVTFGAGSNLKIKGADFVEKNNVYALNGNGNDSLKVEKGANLIIEDMAKNTYNIAKGFGTNEGENFTVVSDNALLQAQMVLNKDAKELKAVVTAKSADQIISSGITSTSSANVVSQIANQLANAGGDPDNVAPENQAAAKFLMNVMSGAASGNKTAQNMKDAMDSALNIGENLGANASAAAVANNVTGITTQRLSFTNVSTTPQGGHGKVERKYKSGEGVWAQYMHGKDKVEDMPMSDTTTTYDSQYNGIVFGYDFKEVGKTHTGIAFNYGSGDSNGATSSTHSRSEFDFWGVGLYHSIMNDDTNLVFDINYNKSDTDVTQNGLGGLVTANPKTDTISVGVKAEKLIQNGPVQIVPYAGLRYMTINTDDYRVAALNATYSPERQNVWLIPVGVSLRQENTYENGWKVTPKADLSYIWALGDTDSSMSVAVGNVAPFTNEYTVMDNGSFLGTLGIEAEKGDWTYGLSYSYQKGEYQRSDKWFVDVRYSF